MGKIQVEIYYTDKLESIRVDQQKMEIPTAIKTKPVIAWFGPTGGRVNWRGLAAEIRAMDPNRDENATYNFLFNGPDDKKREFMTCVKNENLGEEAQQESKAKTEQDYLINAENFHQMGNESAAFLNYKIAAEEYDSPQAQYEVAVRYQNGIGVEKSEEKAVGWYYKAAENGFMAAQMEIAKRNECGIGIEKNDEEAVRWYEIAAKNGNLTAQIKMAEQRKNGVEEIKTEREASKWYERIAENENAEELYNVALRYENGNGVQPNVNIAFELYQQAAQKGNSRAQHALGVIYEDGVIAQLDMKKAIEWYEIAAKNGNADAECDLGYCYQFGKGVQRNLNKAIELYEKSASQGNMYAQCNLGVCYEKGIGVSAEKVKARALYKAAANQGHPGAQYKLALGYLKFKSTEQVKTSKLENDIEDFVEVDKINFVMEWMRNAAQNGILPAQMFLGDIYCIYDDSNGKDGVSKEERKKYYQMAAEQGEPKAEYELGKYCIEDKNESMKWLQKAASQNYIDTGIGQNTQTGEKIVIGIYFKLNSDKTFGIDRMTWNGDTMNTLEQLGVISALNDSYRESHGLASSNALDSAFDELENALDDALADSSSSVSMAEPESETVSVAESTVYDEPEEYTQNQTESDSTGYEIHQNSLAEDIYISIGDYTSGNMTEEQKAEFRSYGENAFYSAWQDAMYSDVYRCWGRYGYLVAWEQFGDYLDFYEGIFGSERLKDYDSIYNNAPTGMETDDEAGYYVDEVLALAEKNNADMIFN